MTPSNEITIEHASIEDAKEILQPQKLAYVSEAEIIDDLPIAPLHQTLDEILSDFERQVLLTIKLGGTIIGSVRCYLDECTCYIGKLVVHPDHQNRGLGTKLLRAAENQYPGAGRCELFTGEKSAKNLYIYSKNGYRTFGSTDESERLTLVFLEKTN